MRHGSLFNGIGGFQLAADWMNWTNVFSSEIDSFCNNVTKYHFPNCIQHEDIRTTDFRIYRGEIDIVTGGFPCQPFSVAGKRKGKEDNRYLWPEMLRAIKEIQSAWVVAENVYGIINQGRGMVFEQVQAEMENEGYEVQSYILPACAKNAPHKRERFWFVAHSKKQRGFGLQGREVKTNTIIRINSEDGFVTDTCGNGQQLREFGEDRPTESEGKSKQNKRERVWNDDMGISESYAFADTSNKGSRQTIGGRDEQKKYDGITRFGSVPDWQIFPIKSGVCGRNDGIPNRVDRIKALGNAIVPQVAFEIFKAIEQFENTG